MQQIVTVQPPQPQFGPDTIGWRSKMNRHISTKSCYAVLDRGDLREAAIDWKILWKLTDPQRVKIFIWLALHQRLLTNVERAHRHLA
ncbi:hypothetical protein V6N12_028532 [Hibiscus sabdariffa]|uniref:Reverse transcriptase zinc-binding domain-containing protein n=1 Tax=Hibiscus sabdariffa TaxID=183260 RepID=A0ABR2F646_9ROSI